MDSTTQFESTQSQIDWYIKEAGKLMYQSIDKENIRRQLTCPVDDN